MPQNDDVDHAALIDLDRLVATPSPLPIGKAAGLRASTRVLPWRAGTSQSFNIAVAIPESRDPAGDCIVPMSHDYRIDPMVLRRLEILADGTGHRVIGVETPGITMTATNPSATRRSHVSAGAFWRAIRGDFSGIAALQTTAVKELSGAEITDARIVGESLGAQLGASMAALSGRVRSLDLIEPVNCRGLNLKSLWELQRSLVGVETERKAAYVERNASTGWGNLKPFELSSPANAKIDRRLKAFHRQGRYALATALGLARGIEHELERVATTGRMRVWMADSSTVSHPGDAGWLSDHLAELGIPLDLRTLSATRSWPDGIGHHALTDLELMAGFSRALAAEWQADNVEVS